MADDDPTAEQLAEMELELGVEHDVWVRMPPKTSHSVVMHACYEGRGKPRIVRDESFGTFYCPLCGEGGQDEGFECRRVKAAKAVGDRLPYDPITGERMP